MSYIWGTSYASCLGEIDLHDPITPPPPSSSDIMTEKKTSWCMAWGRSTLVQTGKKPWEKRKPKWDRITAKKTSEEKKKTVNTYLNRLLTSTSCPEKDFLHRMHGICCVNDLPRLFYKRGIAVQKFGGFNKSTNHVWNMLENGYEMS